MKATLTFTSQVARGKKQVTVTLDITLGGISGALPLEWAKEVLVQTAVAITNPDELEALGAALASPVPAPPIVRRTKLKRVK